jgi:hypothetical protein
MEKQRKEHVFKRQVERVSFSFYVPWGKWGNKTVVAIRSFSPEHILKDIFLQFTATINNKSGNSTKMYTQDELTNNGLATQAMRVRHISSKFSELLPCVLTKPTATRPATMECVAEMGMPFCRGQKTEVQCI